MATGSATQTNQNSGQGGGAFRDVNASVGALEVNPSLGNSQASASTGDIILGDVISGSANASHFGVVKACLLCLAGLICCWVYKKG